MTHSITQKGYGVKVMTQSQRVLCKADGSFAQSKCTIQCTWLTQSHRKRTV